MGFLDELKDKAEGFGDKAKDALGAVKDKASDLVEDVKDRVGGDDDGHAGVSSEATRDDVISGGGGLGESALDSEDAAADSAAADDSEAADRYDEVLDAAQQRTDARATDPPIS